MDLLNYTLMLVGVILWNSEKPPHRRDVPDDALKHGEISSDIEMCRRTKWDD